LETLKNYQIHLFTFIVINLIVIGFDNYFSTELKKFDLNIIKNIIAIPSISVLITYLLNGILPSSLKYKIVFLKWYNPLPASRIVKIIERDERFTIQQVIEKFGPIPSLPKEQNIYWFQKIYKNVQDIEKVRDVHRSFLLTRDLTAICTLILLISILNVIFLSGSLTQIIIVLVELLLLRQVASNFGKRFVATTVAESL
jgi:hypothetical protein